jgi:hypothetical protein
MAIIVRIAKIPKSINGDGSDWLTIALSNVERRFWQSWQLWQFLAAKRKRGCQREPASPFCERERCY